MADGSHRRTRMLVTLGAAALLTTGTMIGTRTAGHAEPRPTIAQVEQRVDALYRRAEEASERYNDARLALTAAQRKLSQTQGRLAAKRSEVAQHQKLIGAMAASAYRAGGLDPQLNLLFAENPGQFLERASALDMLSQRQAASLRQATNARLELRADELFAAQQSAAVREWHQALATHKAAIDQHLRAAQQQLNSLRAAERARLARLAAERARLAQLAAQRAAAERAAAERAAAEQRATSRVSRTQSTSRSTRTARTPAPPPASGRAAAAVDFAYAQLGDRYVYGATGPDAWDCSGLTMMAWRAAGVSLPHSSRAQYSSGTHVSRSQLQPGDLVFFYSPISHVGIYIGGGRIIHAPNPSRRVEIAPISYMPYAGATRPS